MDWMRLDAVSYTHPRKVGGVLEMNRLRQILKDQRGVAFPLIVAIVLVLVMPVSYTHLDVYKRQMLNFKKAGIFSRGTGQEDAREQEEQRCV